MPVSPSVRPYLDEFPLPNGADLGRRPRRLHASRSPRRSTRTTSRSGSTRTWARTTSSSSATPTTRPSSTCPPTSRSSRGPSCRGTSSRPPSTGGCSRRGTLATFRARLLAARASARRSRPTPSQPLAPFVPGRESLRGDIDIGGDPALRARRSRPTSPCARTSSPSTATSSTPAGRHSLKAGVLVERYQSDEYNPTFSLGIYTFANLEALPAQPPLRFIGLTPEGDLERQWPFTLLRPLRAGRGPPRRAADAQRRAALRVRDAAARRAGAATSTCPTSSLPRSRSGPLYENPTGKNVSPRLSFAWDVLGRRAHVAARRLRALLQHQQPAEPDRHRHQPAGHAAAGDRRTRPSRCPTSRGSGALSIRPIQYDLERPRVHVWNVSLQRELPARVVVTVGYAGTRGPEPLAQRRRQRAGPADAARRHALPPRRPPPGRTRASPRSSSRRATGDSWYNALVVELRARLDAGPGLPVLLHLLAQHRHHPGLDLLLRRHERHACRAFPESGQPDYNKGLADYHAKHNWVFNVTYDLPFARESRGLAQALLGDWQVAAIGQVRSGPPLTLFVQSNRSRSRWSPSLGPGQGFDRPSLAPGRTPESAILGTPEQWFDPTAFVLQPAGTYGNLGRGALVGPDLAVGRPRARRSGSAGRASGRRARSSCASRPSTSSTTRTSASPACRRFAGTADGEAPLPTLGRIRVDRDLVAPGPAGVRVRF